MMLITRYLTRQVLSAIFTVLFALIALHIFILSVSQLNDIGKGNYGITNAMYYVLMQTPYQLYLMFPIVCLLGVLISLGGMANSRELLIMRANGLSINWIAKRVMITSLALIIIMSLIFELFIPKLIFHSKNLKQKAISGQDYGRTLHGIWLRDRNSILQIDTVIQGGEIFGITEFIFDKYMRLRAIRHINSANYFHAKWYANNVTQTNIMPEKTIVKNSKKIIWDVNIDPVMLALQASEPNEMTVNQLYNFWQTQSKHHQRTANYQLAFWQRIFQPFASILMIFIAIPFVFGPLRTSSVGTKILVGIGVGFSFHVFYHFFASLVLVSQWLPILAIIFPTVIFLFLGIFLVRMQH